MKWLLALGGAFVLYELWSSSQGAAAPAPIPVTPTTFDPSSLYGSSGGASGTDFTPMPVGPSGPALPTPIGPSFSNPTGAPPPPMHPPIMTTEVAFVPSITMQHVAGFARLFR